MSIANKLPEPPEGYKWNSQVFQGAEGPTIYLNLEVVSPVPIVPEAWGSTSGFCDPDEESILFEASRILEKFDRGLEDSRKKREIQAELEEMYSDLITKGS